MSGFHTRYIPPTQYVYRSRSQLYKDLKRASITKEDIKKSQGAGTYGNGGSLAVHHVIVDLMWEIPLVIVLSALAAHGGPAKTIATVLIVGIAIVWALNTFG
jgi:hypothetical protein